MLNHNGTGTAYGEDTLGNLCGVAAFQHRVLSAFSAFGIDTQRFAEDIEFWGLELEARTPTMDTDFMLKSYPEETLRYKLNLAVSAVPNANRPVHDTVEALINLILIAYGRKAGSLTFNEVFLILLKE